MAQSVPSISPDEIKKFAARYKVSPEFVVTLLSVKNATTMAEKLNAFMQEKALIERGEPAAVKQQHDQGKLTARERVARLMDQGSFEELDMWHKSLETGFPIDEAGGRGDGVVVGYGEVACRPLSIFAQDATVAGGTVGTVHGRKINMIMERALTARTPLVGIYDSLGVRAEDAVQYPDYYQAPAMSFFATQASGVIPKLSLVMGPCSGEMALVAGLADFIFMVRNTSYMHLMPPPPGMTGQQLGDAWNVHAKVTGVCDVLCNDDEDCMQKARQLLSFLPSCNTERPPLVDAGDDPNRREEELLTLVPADSSKPYSMYRLISLIADKGEFFEIRRYFATNLITGFARFGGFSTGIIANNPQSKGGCMTLDAADKMSHMVRFCDAFNIPILWLADTPAFYPAVDEETRGLIRHGAGMIMANSEATSPQITITIRKKYGGGSLAMPSQGLGGDLEVAWPTFEPGLMGADGAVSIIHRRRLAAIADKAKADEEKRKLVEEMQWGLDMQVRESTQKFIDPRDTRAFLVRALRWLCNRQQQWAPRKHENIRI